MATADGRTLPAWYYPSVNGAAVISMGGMGGALGDALPPVGFLLEAGYGVIQVSSRACAIPPAPVTLGYQEAGDAAAALAFLRTRPEVDAGRIAVFGFSMGGVAAIRMAAQEPQVAAVVAEGGYHNLGQDIVEAGNPAPPLQRAFWYTIAGVFWLQTSVNPWDSSPIDDLPSISPRPLLLIYGEKELQDGRALPQFEAARNPKQLWVVPYGSHGGNYQADPDAYAAKVLNFFQTHLASQDPSP